MIRIENLSVDAVKDITEDLGAGWYSEASSRFISEGIVDIVLDDCIIFKMHSGGFDLDATLDRGGKLSTIPAHSYSKIVIE